MTMMALVVKGGDDVMVSVMMLTAAWRRWAAHRLSCFRKGGLGFGRVCIFLIFLLVVLASVCLPTSHIPLFTTNGATFGRCLVLFTPDARCASFLLWCGA